MTVTNVVEMTARRIVTVTNTVVVAVTNVVVERREPERILSARKTAPYAVSVAAFDVPRCRKLLSEAGARVISCENGVVAVVEASDRAVASLRGLATVKSLDEGDKVAVDAGERVRIVPLSSIDAASVTKAVRDLGGEIVQVVTVGSPAVRAKLSYSAIHKLAERGDVRQIERDQE